MADISPTGTNRLDTLFSPLGMSRGRGGEAWVVTVNPKYGFSCQSPALPPGKWEAWAPLTFPLSSKDLEKPRRPSAASFLLRLLAPDTMLEAGAAARICQAASCLP